MNTSKLPIIKNNYLNTLIILICSIFFLSACDKTENNAMTTKTMEVASYLVDCVGVAPMQCMRVKEQGQNDWQLFYSHIEGFEFEPGYNYQLEVAVTKKPEPIPADASSLQYTLVKIISKQPVADN